MTTRIDIGRVRARFPALSRIEHGRDAAYLDGPGGTQVPDTVIAAIDEALRGGISNLGGGFGASEDAARLSADARSAMARMLGASPEEISFGQNMTSLTFAMSRALGATWGKDDVVVVTSLDHDANFTPWVMAATDAGATVRVAEFDPETGILDPESVIELLDERVRLVALGLVSNALGTVVDVASVAAAAREAGALVYVDAVHAGPHRRIDVSTLGCDFLGVSAYKFFGPHTGVLYGRSGPMAETRAYKVRPAPSDPPEKWETGTQSFEALGGVRAAVEYLEDLGDGSLDSAFAVIGEHESELGQRFLSGVSGMSHVRVIGPDDMGPSRVATFAVDVAGLPAGDVAARLAQESIYVWAGHYYAVNVMDRLGMLDSGGLVRIGFVHYNTFEEVDRVVDALSRLG